MMMSCHALASGQIEEKRELPNGDVVASRNGVEGLWMPVAKARKLNDSLDELDRLRVAMPLAQKDIEQLHAALDTAQKQRDSADTTSRLSQQVATNWKSMYDEEHQLRLDAEKFVYRPGKVTKFFNSVPLQIGLKLGFPALQMLRCQ